MQHPAIAVFILQTAISVSVVVIGYGFEGFSFAYSAAIGGCIAIVPQGLFGFWVFRNRGARNSHLIVRDLFLGEGLKLGVTAIFFALVWTNFNQIEPLAVFAGFVATVVVGQLSTPLLLGGIRKY